MPKEIVLTQISTDDNPCRYCTYETGRSETCHATCEKYAKMVKLLEKRRAEKEADRKADPEFTRKLKQYIWKKTKERKRR